jgi:hypothetical protein
VCFADPGPRGRGDGHGDLVTRGFEGVYERPDVWREAPVGRAVVVDYLWRPLSACPFIIMFFFAFLFFFNERPPSKKESKPCRSLDLPGCALGLFLSANGDYSSPQSSGGASSHTYSNIWGTLDKD